MRQHTDPIDLGTLSAMLVYISADQPREDWARLLMAAKSEFGDSAKEVVREWSATASNYDKNAFNSTWRSIRANGGVTIGSLIHEATENGFKFAPISDQDKKRLKHEQQQREAKRRQLEAQEAKQRELGYKAARNKAQSLITERAFLANPKHPYLINKGISSALNGLNRPFQFGGTILVPVYQFQTPPQPHGNLMDWGRMFDLASLQFINADGSKRFLKGGQIKGGFYPLRLGNNMASIVICEGVATGITYAAYYDKVSGVVCAFNARNLKPVARAFKLRYPTARIIIAADNDRETEQKTGVNVGVAKAQEAAKAVDGVITVPEFSAHESGTDWNDRYLLDQAEVNRQGGAL